MHRCCSLRQCIKSHALSPCQKRKIHLRGNKLIEGSCPLICGQILGMAEKRHIWFFGDQKAKYSQAQITQCPFVAANGITHLYETPDFLLWITSSSLSVAAVPPLLVTSSALSLFSCKVLVAGCRRKQKRDFALTSPDIEKLAEHVTSSFPPGIWSISGRQLDLFAPLLQPVPSPHLQIWLQTHSVEGEAASNKANPRTTVLCDCSSKRVLLSAGQLS